MKQGFPILAVLCASSAGLSSCETNKPAETTTAATAAPAAPADSAAAYVCPMGDGGRSSQPGKCPKCGMDLEKKG